MKVFRSFLIMPGNNPGMLVKSRYYKADAIIFDLEDAVAPMEKDAARNLVAETLKAIDFYDKTIMVRINPVDVCGFADLQAVIPSKPKAIFVPKVETPEQVLEVAEEMAKYETEETGEIPIFAIIETAKGMRNVHSIANASPRVAGLCLGAEDYTADLGAVRTRENKEIFYARSKMVIAARAAGIQVMDTPFVDIEDKVGLEEDATYAREMGMSGKVCINPRQVATVNTVFSPTPKLIKWAQRIIAVFEEAQRNNSGVITLDGKMVDLPIVIQAEKIIEQAKAYNLLGGKL